MHFTGCWAAGFAGSSGFYSREPVHANSANMLSLRRGFCTFNSASFLAVIAFTKCTAVYNVSLDFAWLVYHPKENILLVK